MAKQDTIQPGLIRMQRPLEMIQAAIYSGRCEGITPVSMLLVAAPESCKSQILLHFRETKTLRYYSSITSKPLLELRPEIESGTITHLVFQDLIPMTAHAGHVSARIFSTLAVFMDEGATTFADAGKIIDFKGMPRIGVLAAITPDYYRDQRTRWHRTGLLSRFVGIHFTYGGDTVSLIHDAIRNGHKIPDPKSLELPEKKIRVELTAATAESIQNITAQMAEKYESWGFRFHRAFRALMCGRALSQGRSKVSDQDIQALTTWMPFLDDANPARI